MATAKKKKTYRCTCTVDLCANHEEVRRIRTTKPQLAAREAEKLLFREGHFQARCIHIEEDTDEVLS